MTIENPEQEEREDRQEEQARRRPTAGALFGDATAWMNASQSHVGQVVTAMQTEGGLNTIDRRIALAQVCALNALTQATLANVLSSREIAFANVAVSEAPEEAPEDGKGA